MTHFKTIEMCLLLFSLSPLGKHAPNPWGFETRTPLPYFLLSILFSSDHFFFLLFLPLDQNKREIIGERPRKGDRKRENERVGR
jgi:hypothetical protein